MAFPATPLDVQVQLALGVDPASDSTGWSWTAITSDVRVDMGVVIERGRPDESSSVEPSRCQLKLINTAGKYTPKNPNSPYYGQIGKNTPIRIQVLYSAVYYTRFIGFVSEWPPRWDRSGNDKTVPITANGFLRRLMQGADQVHSPLYQGLIDEPSVVAYWPCEDGPEATTLAEATGRGVPGTWTGTANPGSISFADLPGSAPIVGLSTDSNVNFKVPSYTSFTEFSLCGIFSFPTALAGTTVIFDLLINGTIPYWQLSLTPPGAFATLTLRAWNAAKTQVVASNLNIGNPWPDLSSMIGLYAVQDGANIDYTWQIARYASSWNTSGTVAGTLGRVMSVRVPAHANLDGVGFGHMLVQNQDISITGASGDRGSYMNGYNSERTTARILRLAEDAGISVVFTPAGGSFTRALRMGPQPSGTLLDLLNQCEQVDGGLFYESHDQTILNYLQHCNRYNQAVLLTADYAAGQIASPFEPMDDDQRTVNDVTVKRSDGGSARIIDSQHVTDHGRYRNTYDLNLTWDLELADIASWKVHLGTDEGLRWPEVSINLAATPSLIAAWGAMDIGYRIAVTNPPADVPPDTVDLILEGYTEYINQFAWDVIASCSSAQPWNAFTLEDTTLGRLDATTSTVNTNITTTGTSLSVATPSDEPLWTTDAADRPFNINVGGEKMTVTNVTGSSSPQTMTVTRSVNGIVKAHIVGDSVHIWDRVGLAQF